MNKIFLYGPSGSGKSTAGRQLAQDLDLEFLDLDRAVETRTGRTIPQLMAEGECVFRDQESAALAEAVRSPAGVVALGGGALLRDENRRLAESAGTVVCLEAGAAILAARLRADETVRPLLAGDLELRLSALLEARREHYRSFAMRFDTGGIEPGRVSRLVEAVLGRHRVRGMGAAYDVVIHSGSLDSLGEMLARGGLGGRVALVADSNVGPLYAGQAQRSLAAAGCTTQVITIPAGEEHKNLDTVAELWRAFLEAGLDRGSAVVALGGGVTGDLAGFAAATFLRGVAWAAVPTSLLAMVDAALGGKTGFDLPQGKNLVGACAPPRLVLADPGLLATLPDAELRCGLAETVKAAIIGDPALFELCAGGFESCKERLEPLIRQAAAVKVALIEADPYESGPRAALNLGHTAGHAIETVSGYRVGHGEAVAIGMVLEARLAERLGLAERGLAGQIASVLAGLGLPTTLPGLSRPALLQTMQRDKKNASGAVRFALPRGIGRVEAPVAVADPGRVFEE